MSELRPLATRLLRLLLLGTACVLLCGCVYLRLLELKKQFSHFDENFIVEPTEDLTLRCLHPVLEPDDLRWLGASPKTVTVSADGEDWSVRWVKEPALGTTEATVYDMELGLEFADGYLVEVRIPKRFLVFVPRDLIVNMLRSTGAARVDKNDRKADVQTEAPATSALPNLNTIQAMLGAPTRPAVPTSAGLVYDYRYRLDSAAALDKPIEASFTFDVTTGALRKFTARLPRGTLNYDFSSPTPTAEKPKKGRPAKNGL